MSSFREEIAARQRTAVRLSYPELCQVLEAVIEAGGGDRHERVLHEAARRIEQARNRRERAVRRAAGSKDA